MLANRLRHLQKLRVNRTILRSMGGGGGHHDHDDHDHHHGPLMPPFARLAPPNGSLPLEVELVWDDNVAPEAAVDFDAPHVSTGEVILSFLMGIGFFGLLYTVISISDPAGRSPVASRAAVLSEVGYRRDMGMKIRAGEEEEAHDEDHDEEDEH